MNLVGAITRKAASPYSGSQTGMMAPFVDAFNRSRAPSALELIRENLGTAYACGTLNADLMASTQLRLMVKTRNGEGKSRMSKRGDSRPVNKKLMKHLDGVARKQISDASDVEEVTSHPVLDLLANPNRNNEDGVGMSGYNLINFTQLFQEVVGRCYWYVEKEGLGGTPSAIWINAPQRMTEFSAFGKSDRIIDYYEFSGGANGVIRYDPDEICPFRMPDLYNVYTGGMSPLRACFEQVRLSRKVDAQTNAVLDNGGKPSAIWSPAANGDQGGFIGEAEAERARRAFKQAFSQAGSGGVAVFQNAGELEILNWPMKDIIDASRIGLTSDVICNSYSVPTTKLKRNDSNRASAQTGDYAHAKDAGLPRCRRLEASLNHFLLPMYGEEAAERLFFVFDDPAGMNDDAAEREDFNAAATRGDISRNENRSRLGEEPVPWGDQPLVLNTMVAVDKVTGMPIKQTPALSPDTTQSVMNDLSKAVAKLTKQMKRKRRKVVINTTEDGMARQLPDGAGIKAIMLKVFGEQRHAVLGQIQDHHGKSRKANDEGDVPKHGSNDLPSAFIPLEKWTDQVARESKPVIEVIMRQEGNKLLTRVGASPDVFSVFDKNIPRAAENLSLKFAESTNETTSMQLDEALTKLRKEISDGLVQGDTRTELVKRVNKIFDQADESRAETIARTEGSRAAHQGELMSAKESKVVSRKFWLASADACPICDEIAADHPNGVPLDDEFEPGIDAPPDSHPRCMCSLSYSVKDDGSR